MAGYRFWLQGSLSIALILSYVQASGAQTPLPPVVFSGASFSTMPVQWTQTTAAVSKSATCKVYSIADLGDDQNLCKWIAETIPEMIQPGSWKQNGAKLSYFAPSKILVINQTAAVHSQVDEFLASLRKAAPQAKAARRDPQLLPTQFTVPDSVRPAAPVSASQAYPVPVAMKTPKHLFHFIIRYEGAGIIDSNVVKLTQMLNPTPSGQPPTTNDATPATYVVPPPPPPQMPVRAPEASRAPCGSSQPTGRPTMPPADGSAPAPLPSSPLSPASSGPVYVR